MPEAFIIMQIGNPELDVVCESSIVTAIEANQLDAKRVDKHNQGGLLKSEIIDFIQRSEVIVADLTNERPNCYLEIGYAMGLDKFRNLILTAREDHNPESPNFVKGGPKIHFDLIGYDILFWSPNELEEFQTELEKRIRRRRLVISPTTGQAEPIFDTDWIHAQRERAQPGFDDSNLRGYFEASVCLAPPKINRGQVDLDEAARTSEIHTFGWPIGVYLGNRDEYRPRPTTEGIVAIIGGTERDLFDYWSWRRNGDFYIMKSIFEDQRDQDKIFFDTRIVRVTELILYCARVYTKLGVDPTHPIHIEVQYGGLRGRTISAANSGRSLRPTAPTTEDEITVRAETTLGKMESDLINVVKELVTPLFVIFDFFKLDDSIYDKIVSDFVDGKV